MLTGVTPVTIWLGRSHNLVCLGALVRVEPVVRPREPSRIVAVVDSLTGGEVGFPVNFGSVNTFVAVDLATDPTGQCLWLV
jgi:hypothetical protein